MLSKACQYAIRAVLYISKESANGKRAGLKSIAKAIDSPEAFTAKILQELSKHDILKSTKGPTGGFEIEKVKRKTLTLANIVKIIDGNKIFHGCALGLKVCNELKPCSLHNEFVLIRNELTEVFVKSKICDLTNDLDVGSTYLKR